MSKGITLIAVGNPGYGKMVYNLIVSLYASGNTLPIQLVCTESAISTCPPDLKTLVYKIDYITKDFYFKNNRYEYGFLKLNLDVFSCFEETIYLDADSLSLLHKNINDYVFEGEFCTVPFEKRVRKEDFGGYSWLSKQHFKKFLSENEVIFNEYVFIQSSFIYFKKTERVLEYFKTIRKVFDWVSIEDKFSTNSKVGIPRYNRKWIGDLVPDELCFSLGFMISGLEPHLETNIMACYYTKPLPVFQKEFYFITFACGNNSLQSMGVKLYNTIVNALYLKGFKTVTRWLQKTNFTLTDKQSR